jgi:hypothetical protein
MDAAGIFGNASLSRSSDWSLRSVVVVVLVDLTKHTTTSNLVTSVCGIRQTHRRRDGGRRCLWSRQKLYFKFATTSLNLHHLRITRQNEGSNSWRWYQWTEYLSEPPEAAGQRSNIERCLRNYHLRASRPSSAWEQASGRHPIIWRRIWTCRKWVRLHIYCSSEMFNQVQFDFKSMDEH